MPNQLKQIFRQWEPVQWMVAGYALVTGILSLFYSTADNYWIAHAFPRFLLLIYLVGRTPLKTRISNRAFLFADMLAPILLIGFFYNETQFLNTFLSTYHDPVLAEIEYKIFGFQPSLVFSERFSDFMMVELMYFAYIFYYLLIFGFCLYVFFRNTDEFKKSVFIIITSFVIFYLFFIIYPAAGPQYYFEEALIKLPRGGVFQKLMFFIQSIGEGPTAAFPSSHVGMTVIILFLSYKYSPQFFYFALPVSILLCFSTVYIKAHYAIDVIAAFVAVPIILKSSFYLWRLFLKHSHNLNS